MIVGGWICAAVLFAIASGSLRAGVRLWHDSNASPPSAVMRNYSLLDAESRAGYDRGTIALGITALLAAAFFVISALGALHPHGVLRALAFVALIAAIAGVVCFQTILGFNHPKFLVPPHLRGELGSIAGRKRRRREHLPMR